jgi:chromosome segregation ATPase
MINYTKSLYKREKFIVAKKNQNIKELKTLIKKYRMQLKRAIRDIDILTDELASARNDLKTMKTRNSHQRFEIDQLVSKVKELEERVEAFI